MATATSVAHPDGDSVHSASSGVLICRTEVTGLRRERLEQLAFDRACVPESYDIVVSDGKLLQMPCGSGFASVLPDGRYWHIAGGLLSVQDLKPSMAHWLSEVAVEQNKTIAVYNVDYDDARLLQSEGFVVNKFGEEPILNAQQISWSGKKFEWVRRQSNFCTRGGILIEEVSDPARQIDLGNTLLEIMNDDLAGRTFDKPLRLLEGQFDPHSLQRRRLFIARREADGFVEGFLACSPLNGGRGWAFETYRKRTDSMRGLTAHLFKSVCEQLRDEGVERISLCLVPGRNVKDSEFSAGDRRVERLLEAWYGRLGLLFNAKGQDHFKSRFRPEYHARYLCVNPGSSTGSIWSFLKTTGSLNANWWNLACQAGRRLVRRK